MAEIGAVGATCSSCGRVNRTERKFCAECGAPLAVACSACGAANEPDERFCGECGSRLNGAAAAVREAHAPTAGVERRVVSVLFTDLVGFTTLAEGRDAEEVRELLSRYFEIARQVVERYGGTVEKFIGDAVMAVWGAPIAQEDDPERAVRAALDLVAAVAALGTELEAAELAARAGVLTGEAAVTLGAAGQGMVAGDLVNSASRVQAIAEPGTVVVGETTRRASDAAIAYSDAGIHVLRGREDALQLWRALRVTAGRSGSLRWEGIEPPFVGRERELRLVKEHLHASAEDRRADLFSVIGIAGIGKSRLAWELYKYVDGIDQTVRWHRGRCLAYGDGVTYSALAEMVRMQAGIAEGEEPKSARAKLRETLSVHVDDPEERAWIEPRLAHLLALAGPTTGEFPDLFAGWRLFFERLAERDPVVLVFEDMQWADAPLLEFVDHLLEWSRNHAIFVLALARPELADRHPQWALGKRNSTSLSLEALSRSAMEALLDGFVPGLPDDLRDQILDSAAGIPLYAVETVRMLLDRGLLEQHGSEYRLTGAVDSLEVPETLHGLIAARLDGFATGERGLLQHASVLGKTFSRASLAAVTQRDDPELGELLESLVRKEVLSAQADPGSPTRGHYGFRQDLLRQIAYETLPRKQRKTMHLAAAEYLEQESLDGDEDVVEIVASHYVTALELDPEAADAGGIRAKALATLTRAGERAASLAASESAQHYFERALELRGETAQQAELHERAGRMAELGSRTAEARSHFEQAIAGYETIGRPLDGVRVSARLGALTWTQETDIEQAVLDMERSFEVLVNEEQGVELAILAVELAKVLRLSGRRVEEAMARNELALEIAEALQLPEVLSQALNTKSLILDSRGRREEARLLLRHALDVALANDLTEVACRGYNNLVGESNFSERLTEALEYSRAYADLARRVGDREHARSADRWITQCLFAIGEWDESLALADELERDAEPDSEGIRWRLSRLATPILRERGELAEVRRRMDHAKEFVDYSNIQTNANYRASEAALLFAEGHPSEALASAEEALAERDELGITHPAIKMALEAALESAFALCDETKADELIASIESIPAGHTTPYLRALGARFGARRAALRGDSVTASAGFTAAADLFRKMERPFELAVVQLEQADWLVAAGRAEDAAVPAREAREIFERLRATPWVERLDGLSTAVREEVVVE